MHIVKKNTGKCFFLEDVFDWRRAEELKVYLVEHPITSKTKKFLWFDNPENIEEPSIVDYGTLVEILTGHQKHCYHVVSDSTHKSYAVSHIVPGECVLDLGVYESDKDNKIKHKFQITTWVGAQHFSKHDTFELVSLISNKIVITDDIEAELLDIVKDDYQSAHTYLKDWVYRIKGELGYRYFVFDENNDVTCDLGYDLRVDYDYENARFKFTTYPQSYSPSSTTINTEKALKLLKFMQSKLEK